MSKTRKSYSPEQKVKILKEHLVERREVSDICSEYGIHPNMFYRWQKQFFENGERAFRNQKDTQTRLLENKVSKLEQKLSQKNDVLSELMQEHVDLKKTLGED
jgi:transposase-like protein